MTEYVIRRLSPSDLRPHFDCRDIDLNEFFAIDSIVAGRELLSVTYVVEVGDVVVAFFSVSNDAVKKEFLEKPTFRRLSRKIPQPKRYSTLPAVKIGRLATAIDFQGSGVGSEVLDFLKNWFTSGNKTGCRFIIVDAYNNPRAVNFYKKNGFSFLLNTDGAQKTRLMIFDLMTVKP
jgi:GNAT superfamily N-acetyltransferase